MPAKPGSKNWADIKMVMAALAAATTLGLWNLFATIDKPNKTQETVSLPTQPAVAADPTQPTFRGKIFLGGPVPSQQIIVVQSSSSKNSQNSQQSAAVTQTRSS